MFNPTPTMLYTLTRGVETTHVVLCHDHAAPRLDSLEYDGFELRQSVTSDGQCAVCREFDEQTRAEICANTQ